MTLEEEGTQTMVLFALGSAAEDEGGAKKREKKVGKQKVKLKGGEVNERLAVCLLWSLTSRCLRSPFKNSFFIWHQVKSTYCSSIRQQTL